MIERHALVLIPCCKTKTVRPARQAHASSFLGLDRLHRRLLDELAGSDLARLDANRQGILHDAAPRTPARDLYQGALYLPLAAHWATDAADILIVSAAYGLVLPTEPLRTYELQMGDTLPHYGSVHAFWLAQHLADTWRPTGKR